MKLPRNVRGDRQAERVKEAQILLVELNCAMKM